MTAPSPAPASAATFDINAFWQAEWAEHVATVAQTQSDLQKPFADLLNACITAVKSGNKIMFFGNGGSAADAQHLATELAVRYKKDRAPIAALALTTDTSALTAIGNDMGFDHLFARQIAALGKKGDVAIAISTSGNSANVIKALEAARSLGIVTVGFSGGTAGKMPPLCDILLTVPARTTARIQEMHISFGQMLCGALELALGLVEQPAEKGASHAA